MRQYLELLQRIQKEGNFRGDRTGTGTQSIFGHQMRIDLSKGFPLLTTKKLPLKPIIHELLWFLKGDTNIKYLNDNGVKIWDEWADLNGDLGPIYGHQWRSWTTPERIVVGQNDHEPNHPGYINKTIDQISWVVERIKENPECRRLIVSAWNVSDIEHMALPPCHCLFQFYVSDGKLSCQLYQRSADVFLGVPFNIASYALLTMMIAQVTGLEYGEFIHTFGDVHIYNNHQKQIDLQLERKPFPLPTMIINPDVTDIFEFRYEDFELQNYQAHPHIKGAISV